jgi:hypothetical protein
MFIYVNIYIYIYVHIYSYLHINTLILLYIHKIQGKELLSSLDVGVIVSNFTAVLLLGLINSVETHRDGVILFVFSCLTVLLTMFLAYLKIDHSPDEPLFITGMSVFIYMFMCIY